MYTAAWKQSNSSNFYPYRHHSSPRNRMFYFKQICGVNLASSFEWDQGQLSWYRNQATGYTNEESLFDSPQKHDIYVLSKISRPVVGSKTPHLQQVTQELFQEKSGRSLKLITRLQLVSSLRMGRAKPPLPLHAFIEWRSTNLLLSLNNYGNRKHVFRIANKRFKYIYVLS